MHPLDAPAAQCKHHFTNSAALFSDLDDSHRALEPVAGLKTAGWLIGHICMTGDFGRKICGRPPICPKEWRVKFNPGTRPSHDAADYPPMADLLDTMHRVYADLRDAATSLDAAAAASPNPFTPAVHELPTAGEFVAYLMTGHLAYHLGQLQAWRVDARATKA